MKTKPTLQEVERLFPFVLRSRILLVGREIVERSKSHLHFVLVTTDLTENSRSEILAKFAHYPVVQLYTPAELETFFKVKGAKVVGFKKSGLAQSIYAGLKEYRINQPASGANSGAAAAAPRADSPEAVSGPANPAPEPPGPA